jgi:hypothetical protein
MFMACIVTGLTQLPAKRASIVSESAERCPRSPFVVYFGGEAAKTNNEKLFRGAAKPPPETPS